MYGWIGRDLRGCGTSGGTTSSVVSTIESGRVRCVVLAVLDERELLAGFIRMFAALRAREALARAGNEGDDVDRGERARELAGWPALHVCERLVDELRGRWNRSSPRFVGSHRAVAG